MTETRKPKTRVAVLISGSGSNMASLIAAGQASDAPYEVLVVISNVADVAGLDKARAAGVEALTVEHKPFARIARRMSAPSTPCWSNATSRSSPWPVSCAC